MSECWRMDPARRSALEALAPLDVAAWMQPGEARMVLSTDRQSAAVRWEADPPLLVKWRVPIPRRRARTWLRTSRERAEASALRTAAARGIQAPQPWGIGERRRFGVLVGSVLVRAFDTTATPLDEAARHEPGRLVEAGAALRRWHDVGFRHGDCYPKNVLVGGEAGTPQPIGCPKARFVAAGPDLDEARLRDLAQFAAGCGALQPWSDPFSFLVSYLEEPGLESYDDVSARAMPAYERIMEKKRERVRTRPQREPHGPPRPTPLPPDAIGGSRVSVRAW